MINPNDITTIRVDQLPPAPFSLTDIIPHGVGTQLSSGTLQELVNFITPVIGGITGSSYLPLKVVNGEQLPSVPLDSVFFFCGKGTFLNINGYPNIVTTKELNVISSLEDRWVLTSEIEIKPDLASIGISQSINENTINYAPSEDAVYKALALKADTSSVPTPLTYFDYPELTSDAVQDFQVPLGRIVKQMYINGVLQFLETANNTTKTNTFKQVNDTVTLKQDTFVNNYISGFYQ